MLHCCILGEISRRALKCKKEDIGAREKSGSNLLQTMLIKSFKPQPLKAKTVFHVSYCQVIAVSRSPDGKKFTVNKHCRTVELPKQGLSVSDSHFDFLLKILRVMEQKYQVA